MRRWLKKIALTLLICFVLLQFYQPARNKSNGQDFSKDFVTTYNAPDSIKKILHTSCYDCHSNNTNYLWYDYIQPARMLVESHIKRGKRELNFNEWTDYSTRKQGSKLKGIIKQVQEGEMPLKSYTMLHTSAKLNAAEREQLINWLNALVNGDNKPN